MKKRFKSKGLSVLLALTLCLGAMSTASAAELDAEATDELAVELDDQAADNQVAEPAIEVADEFVGAGEGDELVESGIIDTVGPVLQEVCFADKSMSATVGKPDGRVEAIAKATDDLSGVSSVNLSFKNNSDYLYINLRAKDYNAYDTDSVGYKNYSDGYCHGVLSTTAATAEGEYKLYSIGVSDNAGNYTSYSESDNKLDASVWGMKITVSGSVAPAAPETVTSFVADKTIVKTGEQIDFVAKLSPNEIKRRRYINANFVCKEDGAEKGNMSVSLSAFSNEIKGDFHSINYKIEKWQYPGVYELDSVLYTDDNGFSVTISKDNLPAFSFTVQSDAIDNDFPVLKSVKLLSDTVSVPGAIKFEIEATDASSGISEIRVNMSTDGAGSFYGNSSTIIEQNKDVYTVQSVVSQYQTNSTVKINQIQIVDAAGHNVYYSIYNSSYNTDSEFRKYLELPEEYKSIRVNIINDGQAAGGQVTALDVTTSTNDKEKMIAAINSSANDAIIHVDITPDMVVPKAAFDAIKGTNRQLWLNSNTVQWVVKGTDVTGATRDVDLTMETSGRWTSAWKDLPEFSAYSNSENKKYAYCVRMSTEADLPCKMTMRIVAGYMDKNLNAGESYVAYIIMSGNTTKAAVVGRPVRTSDGNLEMDVTRTYQIMYILPANGGGFTDVKKNDYFAQPVSWAVEKGITTGVSDGAFAPAKPCTREQAVTFLWRAAGQPNPTKTNMPFTDVKPGSYYEKAVLWAVENHITFGISDDKFGVGNTCTREQIVTFLWRAQGAPSMQGTNNFGDVKSSDYAYQAILWAGQQNVTQGTSATEFSPKTNCNRGMIVTFLYRAMAEVE